MEQAVFAVLIGVSILVLGQVIIRFIIDPLQQQRKTLGEIMFAQTFYGNVDNFQKGNHVDEASKELRRLSSELRSNTLSIPFYGLWDRLGVVYKKSDIQKITQSLIGWSNSLHTDGSSLEECNQTIADIIKPLSD